MHGAPLHPRARRQRSHAACDRYPSSTDAWLAGDKDAWAAVAAELETWLTASYQAHLLLGIRQAVAKRRPGEHQACVFYDRLRLRRQVDLIVGQPPQYGRYRCIHQGELVGQGVGLGLE